MRSISNRHHSIRFNSTFLGAVLVLAGSFHLAQAAQIHPTPALPAGLNYPGSERFFPLAGTDLTDYSTRYVREMAKGKVIYIHGKVINSFNAPVAGAHVQIWQADSTGHYPTNHPVWDRNFKYLAEAITHQNGEYQFKTVIPGASHEDGNETRAPHIHFKVSGPETSEFTTQMFFQGNPLNAQDPILLELSESERSAVEVDFLPQGEEVYAPTGALYKTWLGIFNLVLN